MYLALKHLHVTCVVLSGLGFLLRVYWMQGQSPWLQARWTRVWPHLIDTLLLGSALLLAYLSAQYPVQQAWLSAKVLGLLAYIVSGALALRYGRTRRVRLRYAGLAVCFFLYIVAVAVSRNPIPFL